MPPLGFLMETERERVPTLYWSELGILACRFIEIHAHLMYWLGMKGKMTAVIVKWSGRIWNAQYMNLIKTQHCYLLCLKSIWIVLNQKHFATCHPSDAKYMNWSITIKLYTTSMSTIAIGFNPCLFHSKAFLINFM